MLHFYFGHSLTMTSLDIFAQPMHMKYNAMLSQEPAVLAAGLKGNTYSTTINCIISGIIKLSKIWPLPRDRSVYLAFAGVKVPSWLTSRSDKQGSSGGVHMGILSATTRWDLAQSCWGGPHTEIATILRAEIGHVDKGAGVGWLSQVREPSDWS